MKQVAITGTGFFVPPYAVSNKELVESYNRYVDWFNKEYADDVTAGLKEPLHHSSEEFIVKVSGIKNRYFFDREGLLDPKIMKPIVSKYTQEDPSLQCEVAVAAAKEALKNAQKTPEDIDAIIVSCSTAQRDYPGIAIEVQKHLGTKGFGFDMKVACSSATFGIQVATDTIRANHAKSILVITPEIGERNINFKDRDSHFIFGNACVAAVVEELEHADIQSPNTFEIVSSKLFTQYSNNIRNSFGSMTDLSNIEEAEKSRYFTQNGKKVFKEVTPLAAGFMEEHLTENGIKPNMIKRLWLHQANANMNHLIAKKILGHEPTQESAPIVLDKYANTGAAGSVIAFHENHDDFESGELAILCSFGAGYSIGSIILRKT